MIEFDPGCRNVVLQRLLTDSSPDRRALYWRGRAADPCDEPGVEQGALGSLRMAPAAVLSFDTYFNSFFEAQWRRNTGLGAALLKMTVTGSGMLRIYRRALGRVVLLHEQPVTSGQAVVRLADEGINYRQHGTLAAELTAGGEGMVFVSGAWCSEAPAPAAVGLAAVFCTFNREPDINRMLETLAADMDVVARLERVIVVNQGQPGLQRRLAARALAGKLEVVEQANFGGAGGFSRGLLAAMADPAITHVVLLDDDILLEPDTLLRTAAFFAFCDRPLLLGGSMLDLLHPTTLHEAGAIVGNRHWIFEPQHCGLDIGRAEHLEVLSHPQTVHYNGWWFCGFSLALVRQYGMPLPCFLRGDDVEFGLRLHNQGVPTVPMPGIAVWHEPFYLKLGSWHLYYETRNLLAVTSLHLPSGRSGVVRRIGRQVVRYLLTFQYYSAALILAGVADYLDGPEILHADPAPGHARLSAIKSQFPPETTPRSFVLQPQLLGPPPRTTRGHVWLLAWLTLRGAVAPTTQGRARLLDAAKLDWVTMRRVEHVAVETWWDDARPTYRRCREHHRVLLRRAVKLLVRLYREYPDVSRRWRADASTLASQGFWRRYLNVPQDRCRASSIEPVAREAAE